MMVQCSTVLSKVSTFSHFLATYYLVAQHLLRDGIIGECSQQRDAMFDRGSSATVATAAAARKLLAQSGVGILRRHLRRLDGAD